MGQVCNTHGPGIHTHMGQVYIHTWARYVTHMGQVYIHTWARYTYTHGPGIHTHMGQVCNTHGPGM